MARNPADTDNIARVLADIAARAGAVIMNVYADGAKVRAKDDGSPVTMADERAEALILDELNRMFPGVPIVAEEEAAKGGSFTAHETFFLVDPLDGTKEFINRNGEFTVNIALIERGKPIAGVVYAPALAKLYIGGTIASELTIPPGHVVDHASGRTIRARVKPPIWIAVVSRSHADCGTEEFLARLPIGDRRNVGSSLKFCLVATGDADVYPRLAPTMEWDTAAGHAVLMAAGGRVVTRDDSPLTYGKIEKKLLNPSFIAWGV